jgi:hypothetical protein
MIFMLLYRRRWFSSFGEVAAAIARLFLFISLAYAYHFSDY